MKIELYAGGVRGSEPYLTSYTMHGRGVLVSEDAAREFLWSFNT